MRNRTYLDPTLVHYENRLRSADPAAAAAVRPLFMRARAFVGAAQAAGVNVLAGTDERAAPSAALWDELDLLVASGLSPRQALRAATSTAAQAANRATLGRLTVGAPASFIVIDGDPSADIRAVRRLWMVVLGGRLLDADELARLRSWVRRTPHFGVSVRACRKRLGETDRRYSVRQAAQRIDVEPSYLGKVERGRSRLPRMGRVRCARVRRGAECGRR
jgi:hypothetical protein